MYSDDVGYKYSIYRPEYCDSSSYAELHCSECSWLLDSIYLTMASKEEADWFRRCVVEIREHDGHLIVERFLRLYPLMHGNNDALGDRV
jgi:hypothetical protein